MIGTQLDLFGDRYRGPAPADRDPGPVGAQLDLFGSRHLQLEHARRALAEGRAGDARRELLRLRGCDPEDLEIAAELAFAEVAVPAGSISTTNARRSSASSA